MKKNFSGRTYYDVLAEYFERQYQVPLTANEQALMTHIMHLCNFARTDTITTTHSRLAMASNLRRNNIGQWLGSLAEKGYITASAMPNNCTRIALKLPRNCLENSSESSVESDFSEPKKREEKIREDKKEDFSKKISSNMGEFIRTKRKLKSEGVKNPTDEDIMAKIAEEINTEPV